MRDQDRGRERAYRSAAVAAHSNQLVVVDGGEAEHFRGCEWVLDAYSAEHARTRRVGAIAVDRGVLDVEPGSVQKDAAGRIVADGHVIEPRDGASISPQPRGSTRNREVTHIEIAAGQVHGRVATVASQHSGALADDGHLAGWEVPGDGSGDRSADDDQAFT